MSRDTMNYSVQIVGSDELPAGVDRVIVERPHGETPLLLLTEPAARDLHSAETSTLQSA